MSGGVDSSVAALLLQREGYQLSGINLCLLRRSECAEDRSGTADAEDARAVAARLGIPFHTVDLSEQFRKTVIRNFIEEYEAGRTPNPCILCNRTIKFGAMLDEILKLGGDCVATGHYAQVMQDPETGRWLLKRGADRRKDQSYFLYRLTQEQLSRTLMPLGEYSKAEVREIAAKAGIEVASKPDSQEICFVTDGDYADFIINHENGAVPGEGNYVDESGNILGRHKGIIHYTVGQRKGLGVAFGHPMYIKEIRADKNEIVLSDLEQTCREILCRGMNFMSIPEPEVGEEIRCQAKVRYRKYSQEALLTKVGVDLFKVSFDEPVRFAAPGQSAVFYDDNDCLIGGGFISELVLRG
jgi:tRNA-specific 2-thiouridylase